MGVNIETAINYMYSLKERGISYSMNGSRTGSDGTGDCSGTIYQGLRNAGMPDAGWVLNTDSMHSWFEKNNWKQIANQTEWTAKRGDVTIFGRRGASGGAAGHVVLWISNTQFIHCTWNSDYDNGIRVDYETNKMFLYDMMWYTYRYNGLASNNKVDKGTQTVKKDTCSCDTKKENTESKEVVVGSKVKFHGFATQYQTGQKIPDSIKKNTYTVQQIDKLPKQQSKSNYRYLLKEIQSWVLGQDIYKA